jgi:hypothetical protein
VGDTEREPEAATVPTPPSMVTEVAFEEFHCRVDDCPRVIVFGEAVIEMVGAGAGGGGGGGGGVETTGGGVTFFLHPVLVNSSPTQRRASRVNMKYGFFIVYPPPIFSGSFQGLHSIMNPGMSIMP